VDGFQEFFLEHYSRVRRALIVAFGSPELAEDATQEAFIRACVRWRRVRSMARPEAWVYVTATNVARDHLRRNRRRESAVDHGDQGVATRDIADATIARVDVGQALVSLPPRQRLAVVLRYLADLTNNEVAHAMRCSTGTVKSTLHSALANLRVELEEVQR